MYKIEDILKAAGDIRSHLKDLIGTEADTVEKELSELLTKAQQGEDVEIELIDLLSEKENTREWMQKALKDKRLPDGEKSYSPLPGRLPEAAPGLQKYVCPNQGCDYIWIKQRISQKIPQCPTHNVNLIIHQTNL